MMRLREDFAYEVLPNVCPLIDEQLNFALPAELEAGEPPEARGLRRDEVRLMVSHYGDDTVIHTRFAALDQVLRASDVVARIGGDEFGALLLETYAAGAAALRTAERDAGVARDTRLWETVIDYGWKRADGFAQVTVRQLLPYEPGDCTSFADGTP